MASGLIKSLKREINSEHEGFTGYTHWLIAVFLFFCLWLIPFGYTKNFAHDVQSSIIFAIIVFFVVGGASLMPDLDSSPLEEGGSTAVYQLGFLGRTISLLLVLISGIVYSVLHTRYDAKPKSQHRMLFHSFVVPIITIIFVQFMLPDIDGSLYSNGFKMDLLPVYILVFMSGLSVYLGANMIVYKILRMIGKRSATEFICWALMLGSFFMMMTTDTDHLRIVGIAFALGYAFHIIGDLFTQGGCPIFFPLPIFWRGHFRFWLKPKPLGPFSIRTEFGSLSGTIINIIFSAGNIFLFWYIFL